jgi:hypothetical protein
MTIRERIAQLDSDGREDVQQNLRSAIFHLAHCWDALRDAENILNGAGGDFEIEVDQIGGATGEVAAPKGAFRLSLECILDNMEAST